MKSDNTIVQTFDIVKYTPAPLLPEERKKLRSSLQLTSNDLFYDGEPTKWQGTRLLSSLVKSGRSCVVTGERGSGMGSAVAWLAGEDEDSFAALVPEDLTDVYRQLWQEMGQPDTPS